MVFLTPATWDADYQMTLTMAHSQIVSVNILHAFETVSPFRYLSLQNDRKDKKTVIKARILVQLSNI